MSFVFYDTETTGLDSAFDQILQFAAIKTDAELNEIERFEIRSRLCPSVIPHPKALHVTGTTVDRLTDSGLPTRYDMTCQIRAKLLDWSPAIFVGHNSIAFDEHFLRQSLYQSLQPPYLTNTSGNCRSDSLRIIQAAVALEPGCIEVPTVNGKRSFKLDQLAPANGFEHSNAHDALADVEATIAVCRLLLERVPEVWSNLCRVSQKQAALDFIASEETICLVETYYGNTYAWIVAPLGRNPENPAEFLVFDVLVDPESLGELDDDELVGRLTASPKPVRAIRANACPLIFPSEDAPEIADATKMDADVLGKRVEMLKGDDGLRQRLINGWISTRPSWEQSIHVEKQIYDGFLTRKDEEILSAFHKTDWSDRHEHLQSISDLRARTLGARVIYEESPDDLPAEAKEEIDQEYAWRILADDDSSPPWLTITKAIAATDELIAGGEGPDKLLLDYRTYLESRLELAQKQLK